jgi:hypothetical protein
VSPCLSAENINYSFISYYSLFDYAAVVAGVVVVGATAAVSAAFTLSRKLSAAAFAHIVGTAVMLLLGSVIVAGWQRLIAATSEPIAFN